MRLAIFIITGSNISPTCNEPLGVILFCFVKQLGKKVVEILYVLFCGICGVDFN